MAFHKPKISDKTREQRRKNRHKIFWSNTLGNILGSLFYVTIIILIVIPVIAFYLGNMYSNYVNGFMYFLLTITYPKLINKTILCLIWMVKYNVPVPKTSIPYKIFLEQDESYVIKVQNVVTIFWIVSSIVLSIYFANFTLLYIIILYLFQRFLSPKMDNSLKLNFKRT